MDLRIRRAHRGCREKRLEDRQTLGPLAACAATRMETAMPLLRPAILLGLILTMGAPAGAQDPVSEPA